MQVSGERGGWTAKPITCLPSATILRTCAAQAGARSCSIGGPAALVKSAIRDDRFLVLRSWMIATLGGFYVAARARARSGRFSRAPVAAADPVPQRGSVRVLRPYGSGAFSRRHGR